MAGGKRRSSAGKASKARSRGPKNVYASVFVSEVLDALISSKKKTLVSNPRTVSKWLSKLRTSLLRKVSSASRVVFKDQIDYTVEIKNRTKRLEELKHQLLEKTKESIKQRLEVVDTASKTGPAIEYGLRNKVTLLGEKIGDLANQLDSVGKDLQARVQAFSSTIAVVESALKEKGKKGMSSSSSKQKASNSVTSETPDAAMLLGEHLSQY